MRHDPVTRRGLPDEVYDRLRAQILAGDLPSGMRLNEVEFADSLGVSRGPIREAIMRLRQAGLVQTGWHRASVVTELSLEDAKELYSLRTAIEILAIQLAIEVATEDDIATMSDLVDQLAAAADAKDDREMLRLDIEFHDSVYRAAHHQRLYSAWGTLRAQVSLLLLHRRVGESDSYRDVSVEQHRTILRVITEKDTENAAALISEHIREAYERLAERLMANEVTPDATPREVKARAAK